MTPRTSRIAGLAAPLVVATLLAAAHGMIFVFAPREVTMGDVQRILYLHVAVAWCGLAGCLAMGGTAALYLLRRDLIWDHWSRASGEVGWLCTTLTLATGSLWAHEAWNTWWTWEPRLTTFLILWILYAGYHVVRGSLRSQAKRTVSAVMGIVFFVNLPIVWKSIEWWRGSLHPKNVTMTGEMRATLLLGMAAWIVVYLAATLQRMRLEYRAEARALADDGAPEAAAGGAGA